MAFEQKSEQVVAAKPDSQFFMLPNFVLSLIERVLNKVLQLDATLIDKLSTVKHKPLKVEIRNWQQQIALTFDGKLLHLYSASDENSAECMISADIDTLMALKDPAMLTQLIRQDKLDLQGDLNVAQAYSAAFSGLDIDWPEQLSHYIGDAPAQQLYIQLNALRSKERKARQQISTTLTSLCQDELAVTIHPLELEQFKQQNRVLKGQVAAIEQRINALINSSNTNSR